MFGIIRDLKIRILPRKMQAVGWSGAYNFLTGEIFIGSSEKDVPVVLQHESIHKLLHEKFDLESAWLWDKVADDIDITPKEVPYTWKHTPKAEIATRHKVKDIVLPKTWKEDYGSQLKNKLRRK